ncbi:MAG TPA: fibronectin type III domain-containing protein [Sedimentisphaerales bacterium]|nr:fibronectin type III domain-containing protein [Sedimentisphaerales bacterium]
MNETRNSSLLGEITAIIVICCCSLPTQAKYGGGTGGPNDPYLIYTASQMNAIGADANDWDKCFKLMADIDLGAFTGTSFNIIGTWNPRFPFTGVFDGNYHTISNFTYNSNSTNGIGLFGLVQAGEIKNLGLIAPDVDAWTRGYIGSLVGYLKEDGTIANCYAYGGTVSGKYNVGGLVGSQSEATITNCYSTGSVSGNSQVGGLVGYNSWSTISNCYSTGSVTGTGSAGGLVGRNSSSCTITNCYSTGSVEGDYAGGLVGINFGTIYNCYSAGSASESDNAGGLVGMDKGYIGLCYWDIETSGMSESDGGEGKSTAEMKSMSTYEGWGYGAAWTIDEGVDYPRLAWENTPGLPIEDTPHNYGGGSGTVSDPYLIYSAEQLNTIGGYPADFGCHFKLMTDIDLSGFPGSEFNIIGYVVGFSGVFDGNGRTIANFTYSSPDKRRLGIFGYVDDPNAEIKNLGLIAPYVDAGTGSGVGSLVSRLEYGTISNCYIKGGTVTGYYTVGGLVASNDYGTITSCYAAASVTGDTDVGGLVAVNSGGSISNCYATGSVEGYRSVGGLVGDNDEGMISSCYASGSVSGTRDVGGLVGENTGAVGLSYWDIEKSGLLQSAGGEGKSTAQMKSMSTYEGWGCGEVWTIEDGVDYPRLAWENASGTLIEDEPRYYGDGSGTGSDPYLIYTAEQLNTIGRYPADLGCHFKMMADIDLNGTSFNIIGYGVPFRGVFDGNGHVVRNLRSFSDLGGYMGLFGCVDSGGQIKNLGLEHVHSCIGYNSYVYMGGLVGHNSGTITNCYSVGNVSGYRYVGGLVGYNHYGTITGCYSKGGVYGNSCVGGVVGYNNRGTISGCHSTVYISGDIEDDDGKECYVAGGLVGNNTGTISNCWAQASIENGGEQVGGLVGGNSGVISNCYSTGFVRCYELAGGLVGWNYYGTILKCYSTAAVRGDYEVGGLVGSNSGPITNCYSTGSVSGNNDIGGLMGHNSGTITNCYSVGDVSGESQVAGLVGYNYYSTIINCYSIGSVSGDDDVGGLVGHRKGGEITASFWDTETSEQATSDGGTGLPTSKMQMQVTFTDVGWDFNTPVWTIDEGVDYPHLWWEFVPMLHAEPEITLGTSNIISWEPAAGGIEYYAECADDANFASIVYNRGWITETSCEFTGLELGKRYWYSVKARNAAGVETNWSNVESSLQVTLADAVDMTLDVENLKNEKMKSALLNKIDAAQKMIDQANYTGALSKLKNDILQKTNGCADTGEPDKNDWIITCEQQSEIYPLIIETIEHVKGLMG